MRSEEEIVEYIYIASLSTTSNSMLLVFDKIHARGESQLEMSTHTSDTSLISCISTCSDHHGQIVYDEGMICQKKLVATQNNPGERLHD